ncbi:MAG TPA: DUF5689 domain-containing protein [Bacteroidales bacterium]|nr:DUF5689 domain-containing protein [Bacteroidales bacterium]HRW84351.1 DUF5689 domain-containing protein [Bacteroidales bacterium]
MKIKYYIQVVLISALVIAGSCDREPIAPPEPVIEYMTIQQLRDMYGSGKTQVDTGVYIQGIITLTPELGNVPDFIAYLQDSTAGICLAVTGTNSFSMNSEVRINCRGIGFTLYNGLLQFGDVDMNPLANQVEVISLTGVNPVPVSVTLAEILQGEHQAEYVEIQGVQFKAPGTFSGTRIITDCVSEADVYTRSAASFAGETMPSGNGTLKGVVSYFNKLQILLREPSELDMEGDLCGVPSTIYLSENFNTLTTNYTDVSALPGWKTYPQAGSKTWFSYKTSSIGPFVETTAYGSGQASVISWMIAPQIDLSVATAPYMTFESAVGYDNGATLELFVSTDYSGSATPWTSTWTKHDFNRPPVTPSYYSDFVSSGKIDLSAYNGSIISVAWVYTGGVPSKTSTWELDNVVIAEE